MFKPEKRDRGAGRRPRRRVAAGCGTVGADSTPRFRALIEHFEASTGVPIVLNTSFNLNGEPMVALADGRHPHLLLVRARRPVPRQRPDREVGPDRTGARASPPWVFLVEVEAGVEHDCRRLEVLDACLGTVGADSHPRFRALIEHFEASTGVPIVLDTKLQPQRRTHGGLADELLRTFYSSGLDVLYLGNVRIAK